MAQGQFREGWAHRAPTVELVTVIELSYFGIAASQGLVLTPFILIHTSSMVAVYALGMIAAARLLRRASAGWWSAIISIVLVAGLLILAGANLLIPALLAVAAVVVTIVRRARHAR